MKLSQKRQNDSSTRALTSLLVAIPLLIVAMGSTGCERGQASQIVPDAAPTVTIEDPPDANSKQLGAKEPKARQRSTLRKGGVHDITFDNLEFDIEVDADFERAMLTEDIESLNGKKVIVRGFILGASVFQQKGIEEFVLVRDNQECCFGPGAKIYHNIWINMDDGESCDFSFRPVKTEGILTIRPWANPADGKVYSVFHIQAERVRPE